MITILFKMLLWWIIKIVIFLIKHTIFFLFFVVILLLLIRTNFRGRLFSLLLWIQKRLIKRTINSVIRISRGVLWNVYWFKGFRTILDTISGVQILRNICLWINWNIFSFSILSYLSKFILRIVDIWLIVTAIIVILCLGSILCKASVDVLRNVLTIVILLLSLRVINPLYGRILWAIILLFLSWDTSTVLLLVLAWW